MYYPIYRLCSTHIANITVYKSAIFQEGYFSKVSELIIPVLTVCLDQHQIMLIDGYELLHFQLYIMC